ncbi:MAG: flagellar protein FlaG [Roseibium sp.]|uniref:flagellar protein FlaG n=1 Tax=Roseibium sp. TaxID=1936156 RepID=UPI00260A658E|nr:flagellar protein FlaG [Roseibium sp.]MCV0428400.1 flagellar protein FlaG [Roseibium sp.]
MLDTGLARPPSPTYTAITPATRAPERNAPATNTDLPAEETVRPSTETSNGRGAAENERDGQSLHESVSRNLDRRNIVDTENDMVVYVATNTDTGEVVRQVPSETLLRLRAYTKTIESQNTPAPDQKIQRTI